MTSSKSTATTALPHIGVSHMAVVPVSVIDDFVADIASDRILVQARGHDSVYAGVRWLMPTAVFLVITHAYFSALFSELGKDHYKILKRAALALYHRMAAFRLHRTGTPGKLTDEARYSMGFSILVVTGKEINFKLLIQPDLSAVDATCALGAFLDLMQSMFDGTITPEILERLEQGRVIGRTLLLAYDFDTQMIVTVDPLPPAKGAVP